jgi:multicomponent Na+:H+ antiporter subunit D
VARVATELADWIVILPVLLCLGGAALGLVLRRALRWQKWIAGLVLLAALVCTGLLFDRVLAEGPLSMTMGNWLPPFGISFTADAMGAGFALAAAFVGFAALLYMQGDAPEAAVRDGLYPLLLLVVGGVLGAFLTGDLFNLYVWFEVMLIAALGLFVLAGRPLQLDGAVKYGILNFFATALFLAGLGLLYGLVGTLNMADIIDRARQADGAPLAAVAALLALAFGIKAALFPVNAWLPAAYHAPPPVISALLGGLLTKVGVYALLRTLGMLLPAAGDMLGPGLLVAAIATAILGPLSAVAETNLRRAIGFLLIGGVGVATMGLPGGMVRALSGSVLYIFHSMLTIAALYLMAGLVERATGETDTRRMGGLYAAGSKLSLLFLVLLLGAAGLPPFLGFWPKLLLLQGMIAAGAWPQIFALLGNALLTLIAGSRLWSHIFWRGGGAAAKVPVAMSAATVLLAGTIVMLGLWPGLAIKAAMVAAEGLLDPSRYILAVGLAP